VCCIIIAMAMDYNEYVARQDIGLMIFHLSALAAAAAAPSAKRTTTHVPYRMGQKWHVLSRSLNNNKNNAFL